MTRQWKIILLAASPVVVIVATLMALHFRAKWGLETYKRELLAAGEKLTPMELAPLPVPASSNGAALLLEAAPSFNMLVESLPPTMLAILPGRAQVGWKESNLVAWITVRSTNDPRKEADTNVWPFLRPRVEKAADSLADMRAALELPNLQFSVDYNAGFGTLLPHLAPLKQVEQSLCVATLMTLHDGQTNEAFENLRAAIALPVRFCGEPTMISHLVRLVCVSIAFSTTWETLQFEGWSDEQLAALQRDWEEIDDLGKVHFICAMERSWGVSLVDQVRQDPTLIQRTYGRVRYACYDLDDIGQHAMENPSKGFDELMVRFPGTWMWNWVWSYDEEKLFLRFWQELASTSQDPEGLRARVSRFNKFEVENNLCVGEDWERPSSARRRLIGEGILTERNMLVKTARAQVQVSMMTTAIALERYRRLHHEYPVSLAELAPAFLNAVPVDACDGKPLKYERTTEGSFKLYSVGEDGVDDHGNPAPEDEKKTPSFANGRDWVWPIPATAEEIAASHLKNKR